MRSQILIALRNYLTANNASLMLSGTEKGIQRDLGNRYEATYSALKMFTLAQILPNRRLDIN